MMKLIASLLLITAAAWLAGCSRTEPINKYTLQTGTTVTTPVGRTHPSYDWWTARHQAVVDRVKQKNVDMIFIGDSITQGWEGAGNNVWQQYYGDRKAVNMGFSSDFTQHVLWRLDNGEIAGINPKLAVIMIGTNNRSDGAKDVADGIVAICKKLRRDLPNTKILLLAIFPCDPNAQSPNRIKHEQVNTIISSLADNKWIYYLNINDKFLDKDGNLSKDIMPDYLHPNERGYQIWAEAIEPTVSKIMGDKNKSH